MLPPGAEGGAFYRDGRFDFSSFVATPKNRFLSHFVLFVSYYIYGFEVYNCSDHLVSKMMVRRNIFYLYLYGGGYEN